MIASEGFATDVHLPLSIRVVIIMGLAAVLPVLLAGWSAIRMADEALRTRARQHHVSVLHMVTIHVENEIDDRVEAVQLAAASLNFSILDEAGKLAGLRLIFRQLANVSIAVLLDPEGKQAAPPVYLAQRSLIPGLENRLIIADEDVRRFADAIPFSAARSVGTAIGPSYVTDGGSPRLAIAVRTVGDMVLAVEVSLEPLMRYVATPRLGPRARLFVVDADGAVILGRDRDAVARHEARATWPLVVDTLGGGGAAGEYDDPIHGASLGVGGPLGRLGWIVLLSEPIEDALLPSALLKRQMLLWLLISAVAAVGLGWLGGRELMRPIEALHDGVERLHRGDLSHRVAGSSRRDELGDLARAFNDMAGEIERWNIELESRVEEKATELRDTHEMLLRAQKLAAVGQLGAGVAHEINNPLAGILGMTQLVLNKIDEGSKPYTMLKSVEREALRIREIVNSLSRLAAGDEGVMLRPIDVHTALEHAMSLLEHQMRDQGIRVLREFSDVPEVSGDAARLTEAFLQLFTNAKRAMPTGGTLTLSTRALKGQLVQVRIEDTGVGIEKNLQERVFEPFFTQKQEWQSKGMGLTTVNRIVEAHHGSISVESEPNVGAAFIITLPVAQTRTLL